MIWTQRAGLGALILMGVGHGGSAAAATKVVVFPVVSLPGEVELGPAEEMTSALLEEFGLQKPIEVIEGKPPAAAVGTPDTGRAPARSDAEYRAALGDINEGAKLAQRLRFPQAIRHLRKGIDGLTRNLDLLDDYQRLIDAYLLLSVAYFRRGKQAAGTNVMEQATRLRPELQLDPNEYPPMFRELFARTRARALERKRGTVRVTSAPAGAEVFLNGRSMGKTPLRIDSVIPGQNHVVLRLEQLAWAATVEVRAGAVVEKHANLGAGGPEAPVTMGDGIAANRFDREVRKTARALARDAGGEYVVVAAIGRGNGVFAVGGFLGNAKNGKWMALDPVAPDFDMLSAEIEAHGMARDVVAKIKAFKPDIGNETIPFIAGKPLGSGKRGAGLEERVVQFVGADVVGRVAGRGPVASSSASSSGRAPVTTGHRPLSGTGRSGSEEANPVAVPEVKGVATARRPAAASRRPIGASAQTAGEPALVAPPGEDVDHGPVMRGRAGVDAESMDIDAMIEAQASGDEAELMPQEVIDAGDGGKGPLASDLEAEADAGASSGAITDSFWFWFAMVGGALAVGGGVTAAVLVTQPSAPSSVRVLVVW